MSAIESIGINYGESDMESEYCNGDSEEEFSNEFNKILDHEQKVKELEEELSKANQDKKRMINEIRQKFMKHASKHEIVSNALKHFDEHGECFGFDDEILDGFKDDLEENSEDILLAIRAAVLTLTLNGNASLGPVTRRRENLHILVCLLQLQEFELFSENLDNFISTVFMHLCGEDSHWGEMTKAEVDCMLELTNRMNDVPAYLRSLMKSLFNQLLPTIETCH